MYNLTLFGTCMEVLVSNVTNLFRSGEVVFKCLSNNFSTIDPPEWDLFKSIGSPLTGNPNMRAMSYRVKGMSLSPTWNARASAFHLVAITSRIRPLASMLQWRFNNHPNGVVCSWLLDSSAKLLLTSINLLTLHWWRIRDATSILAIALATCKMEIHRIRISHKIIDH